MTFPLLKTPQRVLYVDDKGSFLEALRKSLPFTHSRYFSTSPETAVYRMEAEGVHWRKLEALLAEPAAPDFSERRFGMASRVIASHFSSWSRFNLTSVVVVDYSMPLMNGLEMIRTLGAWPGRRILLTGEADYNVAVAAFNAGLIQRFIPKDQRDLVTVLRKACDEMHSTVCAHIGQMLRPTLSQENKDLLDTPTVAAALTKKIEELMWDEYVVIGRPFGLLGLSHDGPLQWLQLETTDSLEQLAEIASEDGLRGNDVDGIRSGQFILTSEIHRELELNGEPPLIDAEIIHEHPTLYCGVYDLPHKPVTADVYGFDDIIAPADEAHSLLRDLAASHTSLSATTIDNRAEPSEAMRRYLKEQSVGVTDVDTVLKRIGSFVKQSPIHRDALSTALLKSGLPNDLKSLVTRSMQV